jgi:hypothetical protein
MQISKIERKARGFRHSSKAMNNSAFEAESRQHEMTYHAQVEETLQTPLLLATW